MKTKLQIPCLTIILIVCLCATTMAGEHGHKAPKKVGILLVAFGSSYPGAEVSFDNIDKKVEATYLGITVRWAYTSTIIRKKLAKRGKHLDLYQKWSRFGGLK